MARYAIVVGGSVLNVIEAEGDGAQALAERNGGSAIASDTADLGDTYDGTSFERPATVPVVPTVVTQRQARLALLGAGLLDAVDAAIDAIPDPATRAAARITWDYGQEVVRDNPVLLAMAASLDLEPEQVDALFIAAAGL